MKSIYTPWGPSQDITQIGRGIFSVSCAGHGGIFVPNDMLLTMPEALRTNCYGGGNWFEEDCEWALVALAFPDLFSAYAVWIAGQSIRGSDCYKTAAAWLQTEAGEQVSALIDDYFAAHAKDYHIGSMSTAGNRWDCSASTLDGTDHIRFKCEDYPKFREPFSLAQLAELKAEVCHE